MAIIPAWVIAKLSREARRAKESQPPSDLQKAEEEQRDEEAAERVHEMAPGWYPDAEDEAIRRYFDGRAFTATERWDGNAWLHEESGP